MASLLEDLKSQRDQRLATLDALSAAAQKASPPGYTDEQRAERDTAQARAEELNRDIAAEENRRAFVRSAPTVPAEAAASVITAMTPEAPRPFKTLGEQLQAVARATKNPMAPPNPGLLALNEWFAMQAAASGASELIGSDGGFLVQSDFQTDLITRVYNAGILAARCQRREIGPNANGVTINVIDETSRANGSRSGGVQAYWTAEAGLKTASRPKLARLKFDLDKLTGMYYATDELLGDAVSLESFVTAEFVKEFKFKLDDAIYRGTGVGMPRGILNAAALVTVSKETGQAADTLIAENIWKMYARIPGANRRNATWYINNALWPQIFQLNQVIGLGGVPLFQAPNGIAGAPFGTLLGRPIEDIEYASAPGDVGDIVLADLNEYLLIEKGGIQRASSIHVLFTTDETAFRWVWRVNGEPLWLSALTPFKGSDTLSPYVTLEAR